MANQPILLGFRQFHSALLLVGCAALQNTVAEDQDLVRYGHHRFWPALGCNPPKPILQIAAFLLGYAPRAFRQRSPEPPVALRRMAGFIPSCALVVARTQARPGTEVLLIGELLRIWSHFRQ